MAYDKPGWAKRIEALERVRDDMKANVLSTQYLHNTRHYTGGDDPLTPANIGAASKVHNHTMSDITDLGSISISPGNIDLNALVEALKPLMGSGGIIALQGFNTIDTSSGPIGNIAAAMNTFNIYCPVIGRIIQASFIQYTPAGYPVLIKFTKNGSAFATWDALQGAAILAGGYKAVNEAISIGDTLSVDFKINKLGGGEDNYTQGKCNWCVLIEKTG